MVANFLNLTFLKGINLVKRYYFLDYLFLLILAFLSLYSIQHFDFFDRPVSWDHTAHVTRISFIEEQLRETYFIHGWIQKWCAGWPVGYFYGIGADLIVILIRVCSFLSFSIEEAYAFTFTLFIILRVWVAFFLGRFLINNFAGFISGILLIADPGGGRTGGYFYTIHVGVWVQEFSFCFIVILLFLLSKNIYTHTKTTFLMISLATFAAMISHPLNFIVCPLLFLCFFVTSFEFKKTYFFTLSKIIAFIFLGVFLASFWLLPFFVHKKYALGYNINSNNLNPGGWILSEFVQKIINGNLFERSLVIPQILAPFGLLTFFIKEKRERWLAPLFTLGLLFLCSNLIVNFWQFDHITDIFNKILVKRYIIYLKYFYWSFSAFLVAYLLKQAFIEKKELFFQKKNFFLCLIILFFISIFCIVGFSYINNKYLFPKNRKLVTFSQRLDNYEKRKQMLNWIKKHHKKTRPVISESFYRIATVDDHGHELLDLSLNTDTPIFHTSYTPAANFRYLLFANINNELFKLINVKYIIAKKNRFPLKHMNVSLIKTFGKYNLFEFNNWNPKFYTILKGDGGISDLKVGSQEISFKASSGSYGKIILGLSYFPNWRATRDGKVMPIQKTSLGRALRTKSDFVTLDLKPGKYKVRFTLGWPEKVGYLLSLISLLLLIVYVTQANIYLKKCSKNRA